MFNSTINYLRLTYATVFNNCLNNSKKVIYLENTNESYSAPHT